MKKLLLAIDIGTSACKTAVFNENGDILISKSKTYNIYYPHPGYVEQVPNEWWEAVCYCIKTMLTDGNINCNDIAGIGIDGQGWSAIAIDENGNVLTNNPIWMDTRSTEICNRIKKQINEDEIFTVSGNPLQPMYSTGKVLWYKENMPHVYKNIYKILQSNSFIAYRLTGSIASDISQAYAFHCFDMKTGRYDDSMCKRLEIDRDLLPDIYNCHDIIGHVTQKAAEITGLAVGTPVVAGGLDAACGTLGAGVINAGQTQEQGGQAGGMSCCIDKYNADKRLILSYHVVPDKWLLQGGTVGGGGIMRWFEGEFGEAERLSRDKSSFVLLDDKASEIPAASDGLIFLPYMAGERSPIWDTNAKGVYYGLDYSKTKAHMIRASLEGVAFSLKHNLDIAESTGAVINELYATGGAANSRLWTQIKADVTGKKMIVPSSDNSATLGAAILAGVGTGVFGSFEQAVSKTVKISRVQEPDVKKYTVYDKNYKLYLKLYEKLKDITI